MLVLPECIMIRRPSGDLLPEKDELDTARRRLGTTTDGLSLGLARLELITLLLRGLDGRSAPLLVSVNSVLMRLLGCSVTSSSISTWLRQSRETEESGRGEYDQPLVVFRVSRVRVLVWMDV
jgi:hypothetical protein